MFLVKALKPCVPHHLYYSILFEPQTVTFWWHLRPRQDIPVVPSPLTLKAAVLPSRWPQTVCERLACFAMLGREVCYERIMTVDITCRFVAPILCFSTKQINFHAKKVGGKDNDSSALSDAGACLTIAILIF